MTEYKNLDDVREAVEEAGGVLTLDMRDLRLAYGQAERLSRTIADNIGRQLEGRGLGYVPRELPVSQWERVRVYRRGSEPGDLIDAVLNLDTHADRRIIAATSGHATLEKIRELVCD